jgi:hypothetical protein
MSKELEDLEKLISVTCGGERLLANVKKALTPPTAEELCEELGKYLGEEIIYIGYDIINVDRTKIFVQFNFKNKNIEIYTELPPTLLKRIAQFYESESDKNV